MFNSIQMQDSIAQAMECHGLLVDIEQNLHHQDFFSSQFQVCESESWAFLLLGFSLQYLNHEVHQIYYLLDSAHLQLHYWRFWGKRLSSFIQISGFYSVGHGSVMADIGVGFLKVRLQFLISICSNMLNLSYRICLHWRRRRRSWRSNLVVHQLMRSGLIMLAFQFSSFTPGILFIPVVAILLTQILSSSLLSELV